VPSTGASASGACPGFLSAFQAPKGEPQLGLLQTDDMPLLSEWNSLVCDAYRRQRLAAGGGEAAEKLCFLAVKSRGLRVIHWGEARGEDHAVVQATILWTASRGGSVESGEDVVQCRLQHPRVRKRCDIMGDAPALAFKSGCGCHVVGLVIENANWRRVHHSVAEGGRQLLAHALSASVC